MERKPTPIGSKFGKYRILHDLPDAGYSDNTSRKVMCVCDCGLEVEVFLYPLLRGKFLGCQSCSKGNSKHNKGKTTTYTIWKGIKQRTQNPSSPAYKYYGGRGIKVCERWLGESGFTNFLSDMGERPDKLTLDRIDVNGDYCPENCRWASMKEQANNKRSTRMLTVGCVTLSLADWGRELSIKPHTISQRLAYGWNVERAIFTKVRG